MKQKIFEYIKKHPDVSSHTIAKEMEMDEKTVLHELEELCDIKLISIHFRPLDDTTEQACSSFYYAVRTEYNDL